MMIKQYLLLLLILFFSSIANGEVARVLLIEQNIPLANFLEKQGYKVETLSLSDNKGENILHLPKWDGPLSKSWCGDTCESAFRIYRFLKDKKYDIIFFPERGGYGYYLTEAKKQGYGFDTTTLVGYITEPTEWLWDISNNTVSDIESYAKVSMEQKSIEQADIAIVPSNFAYRLLTDKGWKFSENVKILPPLYDNLVYDISAAHTNHKIDEIIFIGPCNFRKGCDLFIQTVNKARTLNPHAINGLQITILNDKKSEDSMQIGKQLGIVNYVNTQDYIEYATKPGRLTLFTSRQELGSYDEYSALHQGANFIGLNDGFLGEINSNTKIIVTQNNTSMLAKVLIEQLERPTFPISKKSLDAAKHDWTMILKDLKPKPQNTLTPSSDPFVSVCITHFNRADQLMEALRVFEKQTYKNFEVVVMDDGSKPEIVKVLKERIEPFMKERGWRIFYQDNQFISSARNNAVTEAHGELVLIFEDDDLPFIDTIERFVRIKQKTNADIVNCHGGVARNNKSKIDELWLAAGSYVTSISGKNQMGSSAIALMSKELFQKLGGYHDVYSFAYSDMEFYIRASLSNARIVTSVEPLYIYNAVGQDHCTVDASPYSTYHTRIVLNAYQHALPKDFRNIPFWIYSAISELDNKVNSLTYEIPLWKLAYLRLCRYFNKYFE